MGIMRFLQIFMLVFFIALILINITPAETVTKEELQLIKSPKSGANMIGLPLTQSNLEKYCDVNFFKGHWVKDKYIVTWDPVKGEWVNTNKMEVGKGYWVAVKKTCTAKYDPVAPESVKIVLKKTPKSGANLISSPVKLTQSEIEEKCGKENINFFKGHWVKDKYIVTWNPVKGEWVNTNVIEPYKGYWVAYKGTEDCEISFVAPPAPPECTGDIVLTLIPPAVIPSGIVNASTFGLSNCDGKKVYIKRFEEFDFEGYWVDECDCLVSGSGCLCSFKAPLQEGKYTYYAWIDKDGDGYFTKPGEQDFRTLEVTKTPPKIMIISVDEDVEPSDGWATTNTAPDINLTTIKDAECRISNRDEHYTLMETDCVDKGKLHTCTYTPSEILPPLDTVGVKKVYIACKDISNEYYDPHEVSFTLKLISSIRFPSDHSWQKKNFDVLLKDLGPCHKGYYQVKDGDLLRNSRSRNCNWWATIKLDCEEGTYCCKTQGIDKCSVTIWAEDKEHNIGGKDERSFGIDYTKPLADINISDNAEITTSRSVYLNLIYSDEVSGIDKCRYKNKDEEWTEWETCVQTKDWELSVGDGEKIVYYEVKDVAGNRNSTWDSITLISGDYIYAFIGGSTKFWRYSISRNEWEERANAPTTLNYGADLVYPGFGDCIYAFMGGNSAAFKCYNITSNKWEKRDGLPKASYGASLVYAGGNCIYAFAGSEKFEENREFWCYNISTGRWEQIKDAPYNVGRGADLAYVGGECIYAFTGKGSTYFGCYNITSGEWVSKRGIPPYGVTHGASLVYAYGDCIYAFRGGGRPDFLCYNISKNEWVEETADAPVAVDYGADLVYPGFGDCIYAFSGKESRYFLRYNITSDVWESIGLSPAPVTYGGALAQCYMTE